MTTTVRVPESAPSKPRPARPKATPIYVSERARNALLLALLAALLAVVWMAPAALVALGGGAFLAVVLSIPVNALARGLPRGLAVLAVFLVLGALGVVALLLVLPPLLAHLEETIAGAPASAARAEAFLRTDVLEPLEARGLLPDGVDAVVYSLEQAAVRALTDLARGVSEGALGFLAGAVNAGFFFFTVVVVAIYLLVDARRIEAGYLRAAPRAHRRDARELWQTMGRTISRSFLASIASNTIQGLVAFVGLTLLGVPFADLLGAVMWFTAFVPVFGSWLGAIPAVLAALTVSPTVALLTAVLYLGINLLDGNVLCPRLQGRALSLHPVVVLVAILAVGQVFGLVGVIFTPPILAAVKVLASFFLARLRVRPRVLPVAVVGGAPGASPEQEAR
ncbi:MAG TPA: AI-2E family transporter [Chloroflexota bacterium]|nr:AI-2E family transporter [Chloroflexota bacterium]